MLPSCNSIIIIIISTAVNLASSIAWLAETGEISVLCVCHVFNLNFKQGLLCTAVHSHPHMSMHACE